MPPSQLKRLKASLREQGITGPQKSKKQKKQQHGANVDQRVQRQAALQGIRDSFNPFEIQAPSRPAKFETTTRETMNGKSNRPVGRPGVSKSMGEEARRKSMLPEMQRKNKVGGVIDRRIGEDDPSMDPEERALRRFQRQQQRKKGNIFDLEEADEEGGLTHGGKAIDFGSDEPIKDDFDAESLAGSDNEDRFLKRRRPTEEVDGEDDVVEDGAEDQPDRKRSRKEIMEEVVAKSKFHKYERQKAKEEDDDLRAELDSGMQDMLSLLMGHKPPPKPVAPAAAPSGKEPTMNADRLAMLQGKTRQQMDKEYDARMREMAMDQRAAPTDRTKTAEEKAADEAKRLKELEESRQRRMRGEESDEEPEEKKPKKSGVDVGPEDEDMRDDAADFGFAANGPRREKPMVLDDEDEFELDDDLVASDSDVDATSASEDEYEDEEDSEEDGEDAGEARAPKKSRQTEEEEEDEFVRGILYKDDKAAETKDAHLKTSDKVAYTYECPRSHAELLQITKGAPVQELPTIVQRVRALYHPSLAAENKEKMHDFSTALVDHIAYMAQKNQPLAVAEQLIRHLHSLSRSYPDVIGRAFRTHLEAFHKRGQPIAGDLMILTAIGSIYPTSDHFHQVVTPAITLMARWLGLTTPASASDLSTGACIVALSLHYQRLSKRYVPEAVRFTLKALQLKPTPSTTALQPHIDNLLTMAELWHSKSAFTEIFSPAAITTLKALKQTKPLQRLNIMLDQARLRRGPLELHHHRPQPIRTSNPKFEEGFDPNKHYDPDKERTESAKLRKEYKRERKGALRELRKDANFTAREQLREKKERDVEYEKKYRRLVAEIQGEAGHDSKEYEREKRLRKGKR
ncbi:hypothetical protein MBLNU457_7696t1 [Dothideomycetes sp. NU457]